MKRPRLHLQALTSGGTTLLLACCCVPSLLVAQAGADDGAAATASGFPGIVPALGLLALFSGALAILFLRSKRALARAEEARSRLEATSQLPALNPNPVLQVQGSGKDLAPVYANPAAAALLAEIARDESSRIRWLDLCEQLRATPEQERRFEVGGRTHIIRGSEPPGSGRLHLYAIDVTAMLARERQWAESESRLALATRTARLGLFEVSVPERTIAYNDIFAWQVGLGPRPCEESLDAWSNRLYPADRSHVVLAMEDFLAGRAGHFRSEYRLNDGRGNWLWVSAIAEVVDIEPSGLPRRIIGSHLDITELKVSEAAIDRHNKCSSAQLDLVSVADGGSEAAVAEAAACHAAVLTESSYCCLDLLRADGSVEISHHFGPVNPEAPATSCSGEIREAGRPVARMRLSGKAREYDPEDRRTLEALGNEAWRLILRLRQSRRLEIQARVLESAVNGIIITDVRGRLEWANPAFERMTGYAMNEVIGRSLGFLRSGEHDDGFYVRLWDTISAGRSFASEFVNRRKDGSLVTVDQTITPVLGANGQIDKYIGVCEDITERKSNEHRLSFLALHDALTGLLNRTSLIDAINQSIEESDRTGRGFAVIYVGLDHFKVVNDRLGRRAGDDVLRRVGEILAQCLRPSDCVARTGGDEFAILQRMARGPDDAATLAHRLVSALSSASGQPENSDVWLSASIGISVFPNDPGGPDELLTNAELAMRRAKTEGRGSLRYFTPALHEAAVTRATLASALPVAIRERQITLLYQPIVDLPTNTIVGCEALARWQHPELGAVSPTQFIAVAEETGVIRDLGIYILNRAITEFTAALKDIAEHGVTLSVNLSFGQFAEEEFIDTIRGELTRTGFAAEGLELELTESMLALEPERAIEITRMLSDFGCKLAIDDFGTGYSSLAQLRRFQVDYLKIDRSFISDLEGGAGPQAVVRAAIAMAHGLGMAIIAEGVETRDQADFLRGEGAELAQGYLFGKPMPIADFAGMVRQQRNAELGGAGLGAAASLPRTGAVGRRTNLH